ncbi:MAG: SMI1/KNR4 family protein [Acidimicrobiales bacterium]
MSDLAGFLSQLEAALTRLDRHGLLQALRPGLSGAEVQERLGSVGLKSNAELEALYGWGDGTSTKGVAAVGDIHMFPGFYLLSLEDAIANYRAFVTDRRWSSGWLPIFANGGGDFYVVDLGSQDERSVRHFRIDESEHPIEFSSIKNMLRTLTQAFERGVFFVDAGGYLEMDDLVFGTLAAELNPHIVWWTE